MRKTGITKFLTYIQRMAKKKVLEKDWMRVRRYKEIDDLIDKFLDSVIK